MDGVSDICTKEEDINFVFTGFSVSGTVRMVFLKRNLDCYSMWTESLRVKTVYFAKCVILQKNCFDTFDGVYLNARKLWSALKLL